MEHDQLSIFAPKSRLFFKFRQSVQQIQRQHNKNDHSNKNGVGKNVLESKNSKNENLINVGNNFGDKIEIEMEDVLLVMIKHQQRSDHRCTKGLDQLRHIDSSDMTSLDYDN